MKKKLYIIFVMCLFMALVLVSCVRGIPLSSPIDTTIRSPINAPQSSSLQPDDIENSESDYHQEILKELSLVEDEHNNYYITETGIYKESKDFNETTLLKQKTDDEVFSDLNIADKWIYYVVSYEDSDNFEIYRMSLDENQPVKLLTNMDFADAPLYHMPLDMH